MKSVIKKILPEFFIRFMRKTKMRMDISKLYRSDKTKLLKYAYSINDDFNEENLRAKITFHYHAIEKGLSNANLRLGFGKRAFKELFWAMDKFIEKGYSTKDFRFQSAISVVKSYVELHRVNSHTTKEIDAKLIKYSKYLLQENNEIGGFITLKKIGLPNFEKLGFRELALSRYSVRDFGIEDIEESKIFEAIDIATKTPSACNRQAWKVYYIKSHKMVADILAIQGGLSGNGLNLRKLLLVTSDKQYMNGGHERNQTYIDGGLYTMSLLYALESANIACCTLNTNFNLDRERKMRELLEISDSEDFIAFIALGSYPEVMKVAKSPRDDHSSITTVIG